MPAQKPMGEGPARRDRSAELRRRLPVVLLALCLIALVWYFFAVRPHARTGKKARPAAPPTPVVAVAAKRSDVGVYLTGLGSVTSLNTVTVRTRVDGQLMEVLFREGQTVRSGELLARIDPRPFEAQLVQAEGQMARDRAILQNARLDLERYRVLWAQDSIPKQQLDTQEALVRQYEGVVKNDQGLIDSAKLQMVYSRITSPVSGRVGLRLVDPGNIVHAADTNGMVVITQLQPITAVFSIPEDNLPPVFERLRKGIRMPVEAYNRDSTRKLASGYLLTADNQVDPTTGTVKLKAIFENGDQQLFPNQFVNVRLLVETLRNALVVPTAAIQHGPQGTFVFVVKEDRTVEMQPVAVGETARGETAIRTGLSPGELVVVEGAERLRAGAHVEMRVLNK